MSQTVRTKRSCSPKNRSPRNTRPVRSDRCVALQCVCNMHPSKAPNLKPEVVEGAGSGRPPHHVNEHLTPKQWSLICPQIQNVWLCLVAAVVPSELPAALTCPADCPVSPPAGVPGVGQQRESSSERTPETPETAAENGEEAERETRTSRVPAAGRLCDK